MDACEDAIDAVEAALGIEVFIKKGSAKKKITRRTTGGKRGTASLVVCTESKLGCKVGSL